MDSDENTDQQKSAEEELLQLCMRISAENGEFDNNNNYYYY